MIGLGGLLLLAYVYHKGVKKYKVATIVMGILAVVLSGATTYMQYSEFQDIVSMMEKGETKTIEGEIEDYKPMDLNDHSSVESFSLNGVKFGYSDYHKLNGYHHACELGGVICKNKQQAKIEYYTQSNLNYIVKITTHIDEVEK